MIVVDASAMLDLVLDRQPMADRVRARFGEPEQSLLAPHLLDVEVLSGIRRLVLTGQLSAERGRDALEDYLDLRLVRFPHAPLLPRCFELRDNLTAYDAAYIALSEASGAPLITTDAPLGSAPGHRASVELLA